MSEPDRPDAPQAGAEEVPSPTLLGRAVAVFARPTRAWTGLDRRVQWWFPLIVMVLVTVCVSLALHDRAFVPMLLDAWDQRVASGQMSQSQVDKMEVFFRSPAGTAIMVGQQAVILPIMTFLSAALVWFGVGFILGTRMSYRLSLEVTAWSSLVTIPAYLLTAVLAWIKQTMRGIHVGFGVLLPEPETPSKLLVALGAVLDAIGPLAIWYVAVGIIGAAALSGASRRSTAWVLGGIYLAIVVFMAALAAVFSPGG